MPKLMRVHFGGTRVPVCCVFALIVLALIGSSAQVLGAPIPASPLVAVPAGSSLVNSVADTVPASNNIVDLVLGDGTVWAATAGGVCRYSFADLGWKTFTDSDGIGRFEIPAILVDGNTVWASTSHSNVIQEQSVPYGDGIYRSANGGQSWTIIQPPSADSGKNDQASGPFMLAYDLAKFRSRVIAACFAGGLVMIDSVGRSWTNIFPSTAARDDFINKTFNSLNNRFFSCFVDAARPESLAIVGGSAWGVNKFVYLDSALKVTGFNCRKVQIDGSNLFVATERGLSRSPGHTGTWKGSGSWRSYYFQDVGLPTNHLGTAMAHGDTILVGIDSTIGAAGAGLAISVDSGAHWDVRLPHQTMGQKNRAVSILSAAGAWWVACAHGGLIRSADQGLTWDSVMVTDLLPTATEATLSHVNTLLALTKADTTSLYAGTDSGIVLYTVPKGHPPVSATILQVGLPSEKLGHRVTGLACQPRPDTSVIWSFNRRLSTDTTDTTHNGYAASRNLGISWTVSSRKVCPNDAAFFKDTVFLASDSGVAIGVVRNIDSTAYMANFAAFRTKPFAKSIALQFSPDSLVNAVWVGTDSGLVFTANRAQWGVVFSNPNPFDFDLNYHTYWQPIDTLTHLFPSMTGDFVTALALQNWNGQRIYWAATQTTGSGERSGISRSDSLGLYWTSVIPSCPQDSCSRQQVNAWNFAFDGPNVWVATSQGLLHSPDVGVTWDRTRHFVDPSSGATVDSLTELYAVKVVGNEVWIGTANGLVVINKNDRSVVSVRRKFTPIAGNIPSGKGGTYATPVPFSPRFHDGVRIHYKPPITGKVKVTIYDFANNTVKIFNDNTVREQGVQYDETILWDGRNGKGDEVAVGTYFFVVEYSNGQTHWGKIAVIP